MYIPYFVKFYPQIKFYKKYTKKSSFFLFKHVEITLTEGANIGKKVPPIVLYIIKIEESVFSDT